MRPTYDAFPSTVCTVGRRARLTPGGFHVDRSHPITFAGCSTCTAARPRDLGLGRQGHVGHGWLRHDARRVDDRRRVGGDARRRHRPDRHRRGVRRRRERADHRPLLGRGPGATRPIWCWPPSSCRCPRSSTWRRPCASRCSRRSTGSASSASTCTRSTVRSACVATQRWPRPWPAVHDEGLVERGRRVELLDPRDGRDPRRARRARPARSPRTRSSSRCCGADREPTGLLACCREPRRGAARLLADRPGSAHRQVLRRRTRRRESGGSPTTRWSRSTRSSTSCAAIGEAHDGKTPSQVALRWIIEKGAVPDPGRQEPRARPSRTPARSGWSLTDDEVARFDRTALDGTSELRNRFWQHG